MEGMVWRKMEGKKGMRRLSMFLGALVILSAYGGNSCLAAESDYRNIDELWEEYEDSEGVELVDPGTYFGVKSKLDDLDDMKCLSCTLSVAYPYAGEKYTELMADTPYEFEIINTAEKSDGDKEIKFYYLSYTGSEDIEPLAQDADEVEIHLSVRQTIYRNETEIRVLYPSEGVTPVKAKKLLVDSNEIEIPNPGSYFGVKPQLDSVPDRNSLSCVFSGKYLNAGLDFAGLMEENPFEFKLIAVDSEEDGDILEKMFYLTYTGMGYLEPIDESDDGEPIYVKIIQTITEDETEVKMICGDSGLKLINVESWDGVEDYASNNERNTVDEIKVNDAEESFNEEERYLVEEEENFHEEEFSGEGTYSGVKTYAELRDKMRTQLAEGGSSSPSKVNGPTVPDFQAFCNNCLEEHSVTEELDYTKYVYFWDRNGKTVNEYLELLQDEWQFKLRDTHSDRYTFDYVGSGSTGTFDVEKGKLDGKNVSLYIWAPEYEIHIWVADGIEYSDTGDRTTRELPSYGNKKTNVSSSSGGEEDCKRCNGSGNCGECGGKGTVRNWLVGTREYVEQDCTSCSHGECQVCYGSGRR